MNKIESQVRNIRNDEEPYVGMPIYGLDRFSDYRREREWKHRECRSVCESVDICPLAMAYVPWQRWCETYEPALAHDRGTIFPELDKPFLAGGGGC